MKPPNPFLILALLLGSVAGCQKSEKNGLFNGPITPAISGDWNGSMQMSGGTTPNMTMSLTQGNPAVRGLYSAPPVSGIQIGDSGTVNGLTTGQAFQLTLTSTALGCRAKIDLSGFNSGAELSFDYNGVDCAGAGVTGQGYAKRPS